MTEVLKLGPGLTLPQNAVTQTFAFIGRKESGKTHNCGVLVEELVRVGAPVVILDPVGNWYGLRLGANGKPADGLDIPVFGGDHGDLPLTEFSGATLARLISEQNISAVIDISLFRDAGRRRFAHAFLEELFELAKKKRTPRMVVLEEAQLFAPQNLQRDQNHMYHAVEQVVRLGRNYGLGCTLISQRPQSVNKEVLTQVEILCVGQINGAQERKAIEAWVVEKDLDKSWVRELPGLERGQMAVWSPSYLKLFKTVKFNRKVTFDASRTPELGKKLAAVTLKSLDLKEIRAALDAANPPKKLLGENGGAMKGSKENPIRVIETNVKSTAEMVAKLKRLEWYERNYPKLEEMLKKQDEQLNEARMELAALRPLKRALERIADELGKLSALHGPPRVFVGEPRILPKPPGTPTEVVMPEPEKQGFVSVITPERARRERLGPPINSNHGKTPHQFWAEVGERGEKLKPGALRMLQVLAQFTGPMSQKQIATAARMKSSSGTFSTYWSALNVRGYLEKADGLFRISAAGREYLGEAAPPAPETFEEKVSFWKERLKPGAQRVFDAVLEHREISRSALPAAAGFEDSGTFSTYLSTLRTNRLIEVHDGVVRLNNWLTGNA